MGPALFDLFECIRASLQENGFWNEDCDDADRDKFDWGWKGMTHEGVLFKEAYLRGMGEGKTWDVGNDVDEGWGVRFLDLFRFSA